MGICEFLSGILVEVIGIGITVFAVDKLLAWREKRRWVDMENLFYVNLLTICDTFLTSVLDLKWTTEKGQVFYFGEISQSTWGMSIDELFDVEKNFPIGDVFRNSIIDFKHKLIAGEVKLRNHYTGENVQKVIAKAEVDNEYDLIMTNNVRSLKSDIDQLLNKFSPFLDRRFDYELAGIIFSIDWQLISMRYGNYGLHFELRDSGESLLGILEEMVRLRKYLEKKATTIIPYNDIVSSEITQTRLSGKPFDIDLWLMSEISTSEYKMRLRDRRKIFAK